MRDPDPLLEQQAARLKAMGHPTRLGILRLGVQGPREGTPVGEIKAGLGLPGSTLSHRLSELAQVGLLKATRQGTIIRYAVCLDHLKALTAYAWAVAQDWRPSLPPSGWDPKAGFPFPLWPSGSPCPRPSGLAWKPSWAASRARPWWTTCAG